jgi:pyrroloquinoline quinone biosynthesis protein D
MHLPNTWKPKLASSASMRWDKLRSQWVIQSPERLFYADEAAASIILRCDGNRSLQTIVGELEAEFDAPHDQIEKDVQELLQGLISDGVIVHGTG